MTFVSTCEESKEAADERQSKCEDVYHGGEHEMKP
jgi:hypothetical protein